jgi:membrane protease YdiL (CAAX protease family)
MLQEKREPTGNYIGRTQKGVGNVSSLYSSAVRNPIIKSMMLLAGVALLSLTAMLMVVFTPSDIGRPYEALEATDSHLFDPLQLQLGRVTLSYPEGGVMVGAYRRDALVALVLLAEGTIHYNTEGEPLSAPVEEVVLHMHPTAISSIRGQTYIEAQIMPEAVVMAQDLLALTSGGEPSLEIFGVTKVFVPRPGVRRIEAFGEGHHFRYLEARRTTFSGPDSSEAFLQPDLPMYPPNDQFMWSLGIIFVMVLAVAVALIFLTPDYVLPAREQPSRASALLGPILLLAAHLAVETYLAQLDLSAMVIWGWRVMVVTAIFWIGDRHGDSLAFFGLKPRKPLSGFGTGLLVGILLVLCGSIAMPAGLAEFELPTLFEGFLNLLLTTIIFGELLWRGLIQGSLRRHMHPLLAITLTTVLISLTTYLPVWYSGNVSIALTLQSLVVLPMTSLILGFAYERTGNLLTPITILSVLYLLPRILLF